MARVSVLMAREGPVSVVFRRGPTKQVRMLLWDRSSDEVRGGQWLMGRVYPERSSLSPRGELLVYFAMRNGKPWTAVSRPPYFTPLAVWEEDTTWGGGGVFVEEGRLLLRTHPGALTLDPKFTLPRGFEVEALRGAEQGELLRQGWTHRLPEGSVRTLSGRRRREGAPIRSRLRPGDENTLEAHPVEVEGAYGPAYAEEYVFRDVRKDRAYGLGVLDWADWDTGGDLLYARDGDLLRAKVPRRGAQDFSVVARLGDDHFQRLAPSPEALRWPIFTP